MRTVAELLRQALYTATDELYVQLPAEITKVSPDGNYVSAILRINDNEPDIEVHHIRVRHLESKRAYIYLGMKKGDFGVVRFFDRSTEAYLKSDYDYNSDDRQHDINDRCFELGFIPDKEAYVYPENVDIEIGMKNNSAKISFANGNITIIGTNLITQGNMTHTGNLTVNGTLTATEVVAQNGASGIFANQVTVESGITTSGS